MRAVMLRLLGDESGATMVEYGIMVALIAAVCILVIQAIGTKVSGAFSSVSSSFPG